MCVTEVGMGLRRDLTGLVTRDLHTSNYWTSNSKEYLRTLAMGWNLQHNRGSSSWSGHNPGAESCMAPDFSCRRM